MAKMTIRSTFALDRETVENLERLGKKWGTSKSEALRRVIDAAARVEEVDAAGDALAALKELQERLALTPEKTEAWLRHLRELRGGRGP
jgi:predicted DNA-binding protein